MSIESKHDLSNYSYSDSLSSHTASYLWPSVIAELKRITWLSGPRKVFDLGCGNGALAGALSKEGFQVSGVDPSDTGIQKAKESNLTADLRVGSAYDDLSSIFGKFPAVVSLEVVEHVFYPRKYASTISSLLTPGGTAIISTPYHGYWKNLALALTGHWDKHHSPLWDYGHIKFWSVNSLTELLQETGLRVEKVLRVGRIPQLAKSMIMIATKTS